MLHLSLSALKTSFAKKEERVCPVARWLLWVWTLSVIDIKVRNHKIMKPFRSEKTFMTAKSNH